MLMIGVVFASERVGGVEGADGDFYIYGGYYRRRIETEARAKVVAAVWGTKFI